MKKNRNLIETGSGNIISKKKWFEIILGQNKIIISFKNVKKRLEELYEMSYVSMGNGKSICVDTNGNYIKSI